MRAELKHLMLPVLAGIALSGPVPVWAGPVNVNEADAPTIARELKGIGLTKAEAIVAWRDAHGRFRDVDQLLEVDGIGPRILELNREYILLEGPAGR